MKITRKWWKMAEIYKHFASGDGYDFSREAAEAMFAHESLGIDLPEKTSLGKYNGYAVGKKWMDLTITEYWIPDLEEGKTLFIWELYLDPTLPNWFLDRVLPDDWVRKGNNWIEETN